MSNWKADYIRMWQIYFDKPMSISKADDLINDRYSWETESHIKGYKYGRLLEAVGKLRSPN